jgi:hypothetical protein
MSEEKAQQPLERVLIELHKGVRRKAPADRTEASPHILLGPVVQRSIGSNDSPEFYFIVTGGAEQTPSTMCIGGAERSYPDTFRLALRADLVAHAKPIVLHDFDDELEMARRAAAIWPCEQTQRIVADIQAERTAVRH